MGSQFEGRASLDARSAGNDHGARNIPAPQGDLEGGVQSMNIGGLGYNNTNTQTQRITDSVPQHGNGSNGSVPLSPPNGRGGRERDMTKNTVSQEKPRVNGGTDDRKPSQRICNKCGEALTGQFVRALGGTFHLECFKCQVHPLSTVIRFINTNSCLGLWTGRCFEIFPS